MKSEDNLINIPVWSQPVLQERNAVITGGTSGIGYAMAETFLSAACRKLLITSRNQERLDKTISKLQSAFPDRRENIFGVILDLTKVDSLKKTFSQIEKQFGTDTIDIWINNAGIYQGTQFGKVTESQWDELMDINLKSQFFLSQCVSDHMLKNGVKGNILNMCSSSSYRPSVDPYMISKLGMSGLTLGMAKKLIPFGIVVNGIAPGPTFTPMLHKSKGDSINHGGVPAGRYIMPQEVANLAVFLASSMGRMIVGDVVKITGGSAVVTYDDVKY